MELLDALLTETVSHNAFTVPCKVTTIGESLPPQYQAAYWRIAEQKFEDGGLPPEIAVLKFAEAGINIGSTTLARHRRNACRCPRKG